MGRMTRWLPSGLGAAYLALRRRFQPRPFSSSEAREALGLSSLHANVVVSRLAHSGWVLPLARGSFVLSDPEVMLTPELSDRLDRLRKRCFFPVLHHAAGEVLRIYSGRLVALALVGPTGGITGAPERPLRLLAVVERLPEDPVERSMEAGMVGKAVANLMSWDWKQNDHFHRVQVTPVIPRALERPLRLSPRFPFDARILWDPQRRLEPLLRGAARARIAKPTQKTLRARPTARRLPGRVSRRDGSRRRPRGDGFFPPRERLGPRRRSSRGTPATTRVPHDRR